MPRISSKGQVTLPKKVRDNLGLRPGDEIEFVLDEEKHYRVKKIVTGNPFTPWIGFAKHLDGWTSDELVDEMRGERLDNRD